MHLFMPLLLATLQIFGTTSPSTEQLIEKYLADNPPEIRALFRAPATQPYYAVLERLGVLRYPGRSNPGCDGTFPTYDVSDSGYQIAKEWGWKVSGSPGYLPWALEIPLGSYSLIRGAEHLVVREENIAVVSFSYVLRGNANVSSPLSEAETDLIISFI